MSSPTVGPTTVEVGFVHDIYSAEDLAEVPGTGWLVTSGMAGPANQGHIYAVDANEKVAHEIFPGGGEIRHDAATYGDAGPPDLSDFSMVGVALREGDAGVHTLYAVNHGGRSSIEVFEIDATGSRPTAAWGGAIMFEDGVWGNAVTTLADGGLLATNFMSTADPEAANKVLAGEVTGNVKEWHPGSGWTDVPGTECCSANGVDISPDETWVFVNAWAVGRVLRVLRGGTPVRRDEVQLDILPDNVKWSGGRVLVTGQTADAGTVFAGVGAGATYDIGLKVLAIDPETLEVEELLSFEEQGGFGTAASAVQVGDTIWISTARNDRIAYFRPA